MEVGKWKRKGGKGDRQEEGKKQTKMIDRTSSLQ